MPTKDEKLEDARERMQQLDRSMSEVIANLATLRDVPVVVERGALECALGLSVEQVMVPAYALKG